MKIYIDKVNLGATYMGETYDFRVYGRTESGKEVILFDDKFDLREYQGKVVDCLVDAFMAQDINSIDENEEYDPRHPIIEGKYIGKYELPKKWEPCKNKNEFLYEINLDAVETKDGIMIIDSNDFKVPINEGDNIIFTVGRLDLKAWLPIED